MIFFFQHKMDLLIIINCNKKDEGFQFSLPNTNLHNKSEAWTLPLLLEKQEVEKLPRFPRYQIPEQKK